MADVKLQLALLVSIKIHSHLEGSAVAGAVGRSGERDPFWK